MSDDDEAFLQSSEINFFLRHLFSQAVALRPDDSIDFAMKFFKRIQSCHHVLGADYAYIGATKSNRRAFIFCLIELFQTYAKDKGTGTPNILIDDRPVNIQKWQAAGGYGILYQANRDQLNKVQKGLEEYGKVQRDQ